MSFGRRLWNVARAEIRDALRGRGPRTGADEVPDEPPEEPAHAAPDEPRPGASGSDTARRGARAPDADVRRWYANLELPYGASADEVRAAYRRLMRRYHPDRHFQDAEAQRVATELAQALRVAYEGLLAHLR